MYQYLRYIEKVSYPALIIVNELCVLFICSHLEKGKLFIYSLNSFNVAAHMIMWNAVGYFMWIFGYC